MSDIEEAFRVEKRAEAKRKGKDADLEELEALAAKVYAAGHDFKIEQGRLLVGADPDQRDQHFTVDLGKDHIRLAILSDTHGGSHFEQLTALRDFYRYGDEMEVDAFIHVGDWTQGSDKMHRDQPYQIHAHGFDQQTAYVIATYPRSERGVMTYAIDGNHDASFMADGGANVLRRIAESRLDIMSVGQSAAYLSMGPLKMYLVHPEGGNAYAKSYRAQKLAEALPISQAVNLLLIGHLHSYNWTEVHGIEAILVPCFQSQYGWLARKGLHPDIGGLIVDAWMTDDGAVGRLRVERVRYQARANDWDHAVSREVARGWSPEGLVLP